MSCCQICCCCSVAQLCPTLWSHELLHTRLPCPSPSPRACLNSRPSSQWCHPTISPLLSPSRPAFSLSQHQGLFQWIGSSRQVAKVVEFQLQHQCFQWIFSTNSLYDWLVWSPCSPRDSLESSPVSQFESINSLVLSLLYGLTHIYTWLLEKL